MTSDELDESTWQIAFSCKSCDETFCTPAPEGYLPFIRYVSESNRGEVRTSESWREEVRRMSRAISYMRTITGWIDSHADVAAKAIPLSLEYSGAAGLTPSFVEIRGRQIQTALMRGDWHRVKFDGTGLRIASDLLERRTESLIDLAARFVSARDCIAMDFYVSSTTVREFDIHFSNFVPAIAAHLRQSSQLTTEIFANTMRRIATSLAELEIFPEAQPELRTILNACRCATGGSGS